MNYLFERECIKNNIVYPFLIVCFLSGLTFSFSEFNSIVLLILRMMQILFFVFCHIFQIVIVFSCSVIYTVAIAVMCLKAIFSQVSTNEYIPFLFS